MASILDRYGIKEVCDVTFYEITKDGTPGKPVLFLDTLKVSTIEQTAEQVDARGGKGNPKLITWDYGKEISVTMEDALFSPKSLSLMLSDGTISSQKEWVQRVAVVRATDNTLPSYFVGDVYDAPVDTSEEGGSVRTRIYMNNAVPSGSKYKDFSDSSAFLQMYGVFDEEGNEVKYSGQSITTEAAWNSATAIKGNKYFVKYGIIAQQKKLVITGDSFPGTYYITGDTYARSDVTGKDSFFQFIIPKAKMSAEQTFTLEAEGDPTTFNMNLTVLRPENGEMMILNQYDLVDSAG